MMESPASSMKEAKLVVIISSDWRFRALLRAQLLEDGVGVRAGANFADLPSLINRPSPDADLLVADLAGSEDAKHNAEQLLKWAGRIPFWVVTPAVRDGADAVAVGLIEKAERTFSRPIDLGAFVTLVKERLMAAGDESAGRA
jgi:hypothetical protein